MNNSKPLHRQRYVIIPAINKPYPNTSKYTERETTIQNKQTRKANVKLNHLILKMQNKKKVNFVMTATKRYSTWILRATHDTPKFSDYLPKEADLTIHKQKSLICLTDKFSEHYHIKAFHFSVLIKATFKYYTLLNAI